MEQVRDALGYIRLCSSGILSNCKAY
uniref:Uncharacterized protein n=1 Tax=Rhizophora mucronata TaxID=61149 RepID=A0A2P2N658_RHIMU